MENFRNLNKKKTGEAVKHFFNNTYPELIVKSAVSEAFPKSPKFDNISVQESKKGNSEETKFLEYIESKKILDGINIALDALDKANSTYKGIVCLTFINRLPNSEICRKLCINPSTYYRNLDNALSLFAVAFAPWLDLRRWN